MQFATLVSFYFAFACHGHRLQGLQGASNYEFHDEQEADAIFTSLHSRATLRKVQSSRHVEVSSLLEAVAILFSAFNPRFGLEDASADEGHSLANNNLQVEGVVSTLPILMRQSNEPANLLRGLLYSLNIHAAMSPIDEDATQLLKQARGNFEAMMSAVNTLKRKLEADPESLFLKAALADALVSAMRIGGNANSLTCYFKKRRGANTKPEISTSDTPENRALWRDLAPLAQSLLADIEKEIGKSWFQSRGTLCELKLEAGMYAVAANGIATAAVSGDAVSFLKNLAKLQKHHPEYDNFQYCIYQGAYLLASPWPIRNAKKAHAFFELAVENAPSSRRNWYFAGVGRFMVGDFEGAREAMERALQEPCASESELDICDFLTTEATRMIDILKKSGF